MSIPLIGLLIALASIGGGLGLGVILVIGSLIHQGVIGPGSGPKRRMREARIQTDMAKLEHERAELRLLSAELEAKRALGEVKADLQLQDLKEQLFQKQLAAGETER